LARLFPNRKNSYNLGKGFKEIVKWDSKTGDLIVTGIIGEETFIGSTGSTHGTHVTSTIIGYNYYAQQMPLRVFPYPH
jgi:hypothetical protein